jgi:hypothetical protein
MYPRTRSLEEAIYDPQRAIRTLPWNRAKALSSWVVLPAIFEFALFKLLPRLVSAWGGAFSSLMGWAGVRVREGGDVLFGDKVFHGALRGVACSAPGFGQWLAILVAIAVFVAVGRRLPERFKPVAAWLQLVGFVAFTAAAYFAWRPAAFPYDFAQYYRSRVVGTIAFLLIVPVLFGFFFFPLERRLWRKLAITAAYFGYLAVALPLELSGVAIACRALSLAVLPLAFILMGPLLQIAWFAAFFSYGISGIEQAEVRAGG